MHPTLHLETLQVVPATDQTSAMLRTLSIGDRLRLTPDGPVYVIVRKFPGYIRNVWDVLGPAGRRIAKVIGDDPVALSEEGADLLARDVFIYRDLLASHGVTVPMVIECRKFQHTDPDRFYFVEFTDWLGENLECRIRSCTTAIEAVKFLRMILANLRILFQAADHGHLPVGIDLIPRNFVHQDGEPTATYVDLMVPKIRRDGLVMLEIPEITNSAAQELGYRRNYTTAGLMQVLLVHMARLQPRWYSRFRTEIIVWTRRHGFTEAHQTLISSPVAAMGRSRQNVEKDAATIQSWGFQDLYLLRECTAVLAGRGLLPDETVEQIFGPLTHFLHEPVQDSNLLEVKRLLTEALTASYL